MATKTLFARFAVVFFTGIVVFALIGIFVITSLRKSAKEIPHPGESSAAIDEIHARLIRVRTPQLNAVITSPLIIEGEARGTWFFEASFPVRLIDSAGNEIARNHAEALSDWMTSEFVPFRAEISFSVPTSVKGVLILEKDNPSGLPEHADEIHIPIRFK